MAFSFAENDIKNRIVYQGLLFCNSTLLYSLAVRSTGSRDLLFFSAFITALTLITSLALQLSAVQFRGAAWLLKVVSAALLWWVCLHTGISPPATALGLSVLVIALTHRDALVGSPSSLSIVLMLVPIVATALWLTLERLGAVKHNGGGVLLLLILPYLLTAVANRPKPPRVDRNEAPFGRFHASTLILSQLLPTASSFVMLTKVSYEVKIAAVASFVLVERSNAIGGSLTSFYARVKGNLPQLALWVVPVFLVLALSIVISTAVEAPIWLIAGSYVPAGALLAYGTISLAARYPAGILVINSTALLALLLVPRHLTGLQPIQLFAVFICPQLLLMGGLLAFASHRRRSILMKDLLTTAGCKSSSTSPN